MRDKNSVKNIEWKIIVFSMCDHILQAKFWFKNYCSYTFWTLIKIPLFSQHVIIISTRNFLSIHRCVPRVMWMNKQKRFFFAVFPPLSKSLTSTLFCWWWWFLRKRRKKFRTNFEYIFSSFLFYKAKRAVIFYLKPHSSFWVSFRNIEIQKFMYERIKKNEKIFIIFRFQVFIIFNPHHFISFMAIFAGKLDKLI